MNQSGAERLMAVIAGVEVNFRTGELGQSDPPVRLEPKVAQALQLLALRRGEVLSKEELLRSVWPDAVVGDDALWRVISELRRAFDDDAAQPKVIETLSRRDYRLVAPVRWRETPAASLAAEPLELGAQDGEASLGGASSPRKNRGRLPVRTARLLAAGLTLVLLTTYADSHGQQASFDPARRIVEEQFERALVYRRSGREARTDQGWTAAGLDAVFRAAASTESHSVERKVRSATTLLARGRSVTALGIYKTALAQSDESADLSAQVRRLESSLQHRNEAVNRLLVAGEYPRTPDGYVAFARELRLLERVGESRRILEQVLHQYPRHFAALEEITRLDLGSGSLLAARERLAQALSLHPDSVELLRLAGELELLAGDRDLALELWDRACLAEMRRSSEDGLGPARVEKAVDFDSRMPGPRTLFCWAG